MLVITVNTDVFTLIFTCRREVCIDEKNLDQVNLLTTVNPSLYEAYYNFVPLDHSLILYSIFLIESPSIICLFRFTIDHKTTSTLPTDEDS